MLIQSLRVGKSERAAEKFARKLPDRVYIRRGATRRDAARRETMGSIATPLVGVLKPEQGSAFAHGAPLSDPSRSVATARDRQWSDREATPRGMKEGERRAKGEEARKGQGSHRRAFVLYGISAIRAGGLVCRPTNPRPERLFKRGRFVSERSGVRIVNPSLDRAGDRKGILVGLCTGPTRERGVSIIVCKCTYCILRCASFPSPKIRSSRFSYTSRRNARVSAFIDVLNAGARARELFTRRCCDKINPFLANT